MSTAIHRAMRTLALHSFDQANLPADWLTWDLNHTYDRGCLCSGSVTDVMVPLPGPGWGRILVQADVEPVGESAVDCSDERHTICLRVRPKAYARHYVARYSNVIAYACEVPPPREGLRRVVFEFDRGAMTGRIDGVSYVQAKVADDRPMSGQIRLRFRQNCFVRRVEVLGADPLATASFHVPARTRRFGLDMAVDFYDDWFPDDAELLLGERLAYSKAMYDEFFAQLSRCGVSRVSWNYHDMLANNPPPQGDLDLGDQFKLAVECAHRHGMQIVGTIKPLETDYFADQARSQPAACMTRKPGTWGEPINKSIHRIDLVKDDDRPAAFNIDAVEILVSDDNRRYQRYEGPLQRQEVVEDYPLYEHTPSGGRVTDRTQRSRVMRFSALNIPQRYIVLRVPGQAASWIHSPVNMVHLFGEQGEERRLTYSTASNTNLPFVAAGGMDSGVVPDFLASNSPTCYQPGYDAVRSPLPLDHGQGFLAVIRGKPQYMETLLGRVGSPSAPEARQWWLSWVRGVLDSGADGVELRWRCHANSFTWDEFGFEEPVRQLMLQRTGVDIWATDAFDHEQWRRVRGEGYTEFCRQAAALCRAAGKQIGLHIDWAMDMEPHEGGAMNIHWDWRTWLRERLADFVVLKEVAPWSPMAQEVLSLARPRGIATVPSRYAFAHHWKKPGAQAVLDAWIKATRDAGHDGYQFYDTAGLLRALPLEQRVVFKNPALAEVLHQHFAAAR
jgi:hypothetical protein